MPGTEPLPAKALPPGVRPMRADDEPAIRAAMLAAHARGELNGVSRQQLEESIGRLAATPWLGAVAEDDGRVAGWVVPRHDDLVVDLPFRRRGHGRRLVEAGRVLAGAGLTAPGRQGLPLTPVLSVGLPGGRAITPGG